MQYEVAASGDETDGLTKVDRRGDRGSAEPLTRGRPASRVARTRRVLTAMATERTYAMGGLFGPAKFDIGQFTPHAGGSACASSRPDRLRDALAAVSRGADRRSAAPRRLRRRHHDAHRSGVRARGRVRDGGAAGDRDDRPPRRLSARRRAGPRPLRARRVLQARPQRRVRARDRVGATTRAIPSPAVSAPS